jgi:hypothetical protein
MPDAVRHRHATLPQPTTAIRATATTRADHRPEERHPVRRLELDDRRPDVLAGQRQRLVGVAAELRVERLIIQRVSQVGREVRIGQY